MIRHFTFDYVLYLLSEFCEECLAILNSTYHAEWTTNVANIMHANLLTFLSEWITVIAILHGNGVCTAQEHNMEQFYFFTLQHHADGCRIRAFIFYVAENRTNN